MKRRIFPLQEGNYMEVMDVVKSFFTQKDNLNKDIASTSKAHEESIQKKDSYIKRMGKREEVLKKKIDEQKTVIANLASIWKSRRVGQKYISREDQMRNLRLLEEALASNKVSKAFCEVTTGEYIKHRHLMDGNVLLQSTSYTRTLYVFDVY